MTDRGSVAPSGELRPMHNTLVRENARLEMLRVMARFRDFCREHRAEWAKGGIDDNYSEWVPLFAGEPQNSREDVRLALQECVAIGHMEAGAIKTAEDRLSDRLQGPMVCITDPGYDWIRAHDLMGELAQERP